MDWAEMLERMYLRWAAARGYRVATTSRTPGEPQGFGPRLEQLDAFYTGAPALVVLPHSWRTCG
jgi:PCRF domain